MFASEHLRCFTSLGLLSNGFEVYSQKWSISHLKSIIFRGSGDVVEVEESVLEKQKSFFPLLPSQSTASWSDKQQKKKKVQKAPSLAATGMLVKQESKWNFFNFLLIKAKELNMCFVFFRHSKTGRADEDEEDGGVVCLISAAAAADGRPHLG